MVEWAEHLCYKPQYNNMFFGVKTTSIGRISAMYAFQALKKNSIWTGLIIGKNTTGTTHDVDSSPPTWREICYSLEYILFSLNNENCFS